MPPTAQSPSPSATKPIASLVGALAVVCIWSLIDALVAHAKGIPFGRLWATTALGCSLLAIPAWMVENFIWFALNSPALGGSWLHRLRAGQSRIRSVFLLSLAAMSTASLAVFKLVLWLNEAFASPTTRAIALAIIAPATLWLFQGVFLKFLRRPPSEEASTNPPGISLRTTLFLTATILTAWALCIFILGKSVFSQLELGWLAVVGCSFVGSLLGRWSSTGNHLWRITLAGLASLTALLCFWHLGTNTPNAIHFAVHQQQKTVAAHMGLSLLAPKHQQPTLPSHRKKTQKQSAVCKPSAPAPKSTDVGPVNNSSPDIILITVDAFRWDRTSFANYRRDTTPKLKNWLNQGALFQRAYTPSVSTRQSMSSIFSGILPSLLNPPRGPKWGMTFAPEQQTLTTFLEAAGYHTTAIVSDKPAFSKKHGALKGFVHVDTSPVSIHKKKRHSADFKMNRIQKALAEPFIPGKPRFVWTHLREMHWPYLTGPVGAKFGKGNSNLFDAATLYVDGQLDRILAFATHEERKRHTLVIIASDHGEGFHEHGHKQHGSAVYEEFIRVPWLVFGPGIEAQSYEQSVSLLDLTPTILGLVGLRVPQALCGEDHTQALRTNAKPVKQSIYVEAIPDKSKSVFEVAFIDGDYKLMLHPRTGLHELYNLKVDPKEKHNLADSHQDKIKSMIGDLEKKYAEFGMDASYYGLGGDAPVASARTQSQSRGGNNPAAKRRIRRNLKPKASPIRAPTVGREKSKRPGTAP